MPSASRIRKRSPSPVSLAEAAQLASHHRRSKKLKALQEQAKQWDDENEEDEGLQDTARQYRIADGLDDTAPATPDTDSGTFKIPKTRIKTRKSALRTSTMQRPGSQGKASSSRSTVRPVSPAVSSTQADRTPSNGSEARFPSLNAELPVGVSATPPITESDLDPAMPSNVHAQNEPQARRPRPLDTLSAQDASLPSPSLSPITAAANLASNHGLGLIHYPAEEEEGEDVSSLDISQDNLGRASGAGLHQRRMASPAKALTMPSMNAASPNPQLPTPIMMEIPNILDSFDAMPSEMQTYVMYQLLRRCAKPTLHFVAEIVNPALKCDFLDLLPLELSMNVIKYLDARSMCRAAQVSKKWRHVIDSDEKAWKDLLDRDGYQPPRGEIERAVKEGWAWQYPDGQHDWERDLSKSGATRQDADLPSSSSTAVAVVGDLEAASASATHSKSRKRKVGAKLSSNKRQRTKIFTPKSKESGWIAALGSAPGPNAYATAAALAVRNPDIGLPSLKNLHLFKSLYTRHHLIRKSWMQDDMKPHHLAFRAHQRHVVTCLQFDTDKIITGSDDTNINVYDTKTGRRKLSLEGHEGGVWALQYEGNILVSGSTDRSVRVWDISTGKCLQVFQGHTSTVRCLVILKPTKIGEELDGSPIMMPKEPTIITGSRDSSLRIWKLPQTKDPRFYASDSNQLDNPFFIRALTGHHHSVRAIAAHGDTLVSGSYDCSVRVWKISTGEILQRLQGHTQKVYSVVLDHVRNRCISGSMDNLVKVWSLETGACLFNLEGHTSLVGLLDLSHQRLVSAAADSTLRIWDPENGQCKSTLSAHTGAITCFQHDGQKVISGSDRTLKMWNVKTGECVKDLLTDLSGVWQVKFNERRCVAAVQRNDQTYIEVRHTLSHGILPTCGGTKADATRNRSLILGLPAMVSRWSNVECVLSSTKMGIRLRTRMTRMISPRKEYPLNKRSASHRTIESTTSFTSHYPAYPAYTERIQFLTAE